MSCGWKGREERGKEEEEGTRMEEGKEEEEEEGEGVIN